MQCCGRTKSFVRCKNDVKFLFCKHHRFQPFVVLFSISTVVGLYAGIYQDLVKPLRESSLERNGDNFINADSLKSDSNTKNSYPQQNEQTAPKHDKNSNKSRVISDQGNVGVEEKIVIAPKRLLKRIDALNSNSDLKNIENQARKDSISVGSTTIADVQVSIHYSETRKKDAEEIAQRLKKLDLTIHLIEEKYGYSDHFRRLYYYHRDQKKTVQKIVTTIEDVELVDLHYESLYTSKEYLIENKVDLWVVTK